MNRSLWNLLRVACVTFGIISNAVARADSPPNFIVVLADDLGWTDLGCMGSGFYQTPNIDRLAAQGMKFTQAYSACTVCSPTRAALLTGKYPATLRVTDWIPGHKVPNQKLNVPDWTQHLPAHETTIAQRLKRAGYATASIGKWHLGGEEFYPEKFGFDANIGGTHKGSPPGYFSPFNIPTMKDSGEEEFLTDRLTEEAVGFIKANRDKPFFLYLPHYAVHTPIQGKKNVAAKYKERIQPGSGQTNATYAALVESVDDSIGRLMQTLDELKLADRTVILFTSDNGGLTGPTSNHPLRNGKGSPYEGGVRVPLIVRWPGVIQPGSVCETPVMTIDYYPTLLELAGLKADPAHAVEGESIAPQLKQTGALKRTALYWHYPHYHTRSRTPYGAIRDGDWKLIQFYEDGRLELYNLKEDVGEANDLAEKDSKRAKQLAGKLDSWRRSVDAQMPTPNPDYQPGAAVRSEKK